MTHNDPFPTTDLSIPHENIKNRGFLVFSESIERQEWHEMGKSFNNLRCNVYKSQATIQNPILLFI